MTLGLGRQPAADILREQGFTINGLARRIDVDKRHFLNVLQGDIRPKPRIRERLPEVLGVPLEQLFKPELLARPYQGKARRRPVLAYIRAAGGPVRSAEILDALGDDYSRKTLFKILAELVQKGYLTKPARGQYAALRRKR